MPGKLQTAVFWASLKFQSTFQDDVSGMTQQNAVSSFAGALSAGSNIKELEGRILHKETIDCKSLSLYMSSILMCLIMSQSVGSPRGSY